MADETMPTSIRRFETLQIGSIVLSVVASGIAADDVALMLVNALVVLGLTLLVSRGRKSWPRMLLAISFGLSVIAIAMWSARKGVDPVTATVAQGGALALICTVGLWFCQAAGLYFVYKSDASAWLRAARPDQRIVGSSSN